jgi:hypothetical protein
MQNLKRSINIGFRVTEEEQKLIQKAMARTKITNMRAYLLKMAVNGRVIEVELTSVNECNRLLRNISGNINQIAKRANETDRVYDADLADIKARQAEIWAQQDNIIKILAKIVEVA